MEQIEFSETSANINQTPGKHPKVFTLNFKIARIVSNPTRSTGVCPHISAYVDALRLADPPTQESFKFSKCVDLDVKT
jgi:hypothetical protein